MHLSQKRLELERNVHKFGITCNKFEFSTWPLTLQHQIGKEPGKERYLIISVIHSHSDEILMQI